MNVHFIISIAVLILILRTAFQTISKKVANMANEFGYVLDNVPATSVASEDIDKTFRSSCIGSSLSLALPLSTYYPAFMLDMTRRDAFVVLAEETMYKKSLTLPFHHRPGLRRIRR